MFKRIRIIANFHTQPTQFFQGTGTDGIREIDRINEFNCAVKRCPSLELRVRRIAMARCVRMIADRYTQFVDPGFARLARTIC